MQPPIATPAGHVHPANQSAHAHEAGGHEERPFFGGTPVQAKLEVSPPDDPQEREADAVADVVMRSVDASAPPDTPGGAGAFVQREYAGAPAMPVQRACASCEAEEMVQRSPYAAQIAPPAVQRKCAACEADEEPVQRKCAECEQEDRVQRSPYGGMAGTNIVQRSCDECKIDEPSKEEAEEEAESEALEAGTEGTGESGADGTVSPKAAPGGAGPVAAGFETALGASKGGGQPLPADVRENMEGRFAQDFSHVRIHHGSKAAGMAASINAQAFTHGADIYFNQHKYDGRSESGKRLLAHELTHVVQQTGASPIRPKVQRAEEMKIGNWAHSHIQAGMRGKDANLITEAGVPGATRFGAKINNAGYADLYKADGHVVSAVQAEIRGAGGDKDDVDYTYKGFMQSGERLKNMQQNAGLIKRGPKYTQSTDTWNWKVNFPANFWIGEIKPLFKTDFLGSAETLGGAFNQQSHYIEGFQEFVKQVHKDTNRPGKTGSKAPAKISGHALDLDPLIPDAIDYKKFDQQYNKYGKDAILKKDTKHRVWIYNLGHGIAVYFLINDPFTPPKYPENVDAQLQKLDPLLKELRKKKPDMNPVLGPKRIQKKDEKTDWSGAHKKWEEQRKKWAGGQAGVQQPKKFLKEQAKGVFKRGKIDKELKLTSPAGQVKQLKQAKDVRFWSGFKGRIFGALRFRFGETFDKVEAFFAKVRDKFRKHREKAGEHENPDPKKESKFAGWKKVATRAIIRLAAGIFKEMIASAFNSFVKCMNGILGVIVDSYEKGLKEDADEVLKKVQPECCRIMNFKDKFDKELEKHEATIKEFTETVETIKSWQEILSKVETAVRIGVQVASCGLPPGLGCVWGLVAQIGIEAGLNLLMRTDYFEDEIAKPAAAALMDAIVGEKLHNFMIDMLAGTELAPYLAKAAECKRMTKGKGGGVGAIGANIGKLNPNDPAVVKARKEWEAEYKEQILAELNQTFEQGDKPLSEEDFKTILEAMQKSGLKPDELKRRIENAKSGEKIELAKALKNVKRKVNYDKAKKANQNYEKAIGWDPSTFQEGATESGSEEFANAVYDLQESMGIHADGIAGGGTTQKVYEKKGLEKDEVYKKAQAVEAFEKAEKERKADEKMKEETRKKWEEFVKIPEVKAALEKQFPTAEELKKDLASLDWSQVGDNDVKILARSYGGLIIAKSTAGSRLGAPIKVADLLKEGKRVKVVVDILDFMLMNDTKKVATDKDTDSAEYLNLFRPDGKGGGDQLFYQFSGETSGSRINLGAFFFLGAFSDFNGR